MNYDLQMHCNTKKFYANSRKIVYSKQYIVRNIYKQIQKNKNMNYCLES